MSMKNKVTIYSKTGKILKTFICIADANQIDDYTTEFTLGSGKKITTNCEYILEQEEE